MKSGMKLAAAVASLGIAAFAGQARAALVVPVAAYVKPDQSLLFKFENEKGPEGKKAIADLGLAAAKLNDLFSVADDALDGKGLPAFSVYNFDGTKLAPTASKVGADGSVDVGVAFPQIKEGGTFVLVWKDAIPLVIETLYNPGMSKATLAQHQADIDKMPEAEKKDVLSRFLPTVTHIVPLQYAVIETDKGTIKAKFSYDIAPHTVDNFISLSNQQFYDGTSFHRIISGFMIQGGDSTGNIEGRAGMGGPGYEIMQEFSDVKKHERGTLSMARSQDPNSAGSQFFIMHAKSTSLDGQYTAFGDVFDGMNVVDEIAKTPVADANGTVTGPKPKIVSVKILPGTTQIYGLTK